MKKLSYVGILFCIVYFSSSCDYNKRENYQGQTKEPLSNEQTTANDESKKEQVSTFLTKAANSNLAEIHLGKLATDKATSKEVKDFAINMVEEHTKTLEDLKKLAEKNNVVLPTTMTDKDQEMINELSKEIGYEFDKKFMNKMVEANKDEVGMFENALKDIENADIKDYASNTLPTLKNQLMTAQQNEELVQNRKEQIKKKEKSM